MRPKTIRDTAFLIAALVGAHHADAQQRVFLNGTPTNLLLDFANAAFAPDPTTNDAFLLLAPLSEFSGGSSGFAAFEAVPIMDLNFGAGNWLRCTMTATDWAYLSADACAHQAAFGSIQPLSLLTSDFDSGAYTGLPGLPNVPIPGSTLFSQASTSTLSGLETSLSFERWQLRTRGFALNDLWNACPPSSTVTANFGGFLAARYTFSFQ